MILQFPFSDSCRSRSPASEKGFTLPEILIAMTVFLLVVAGIIATNLFGMRMFQVNETKLNVSQWSRNAFSKITDEIRACNSVLVGNVNYTNGVFVGLLDGEAQRGNALLIYPTADTNDYILYSVNPSDQTFRRTTVTNNVLNTALILAYSVTNTVVFSAQDLSGNVLTNNENNRVIHLTLEMYQPESYMKDSDYYQLETSVTRRAVQ